MKFLRTNKQWISPISLALVLAGCLQQSPPSSSPLRIATNLWPGYETLYLARSLGYYKDKPIKIIELPSGTEEVRAYRNGNIEGAGLSIDQAIALAQTQKDLKIIDIVDISNGGDVILGKPEIKSIKDLKGKKVGVEATALGAFFIARALEKNGMTPKDIQIVSLELNEHERAYKEGKVDAVVTFGRPRVKLLEQGARLLFDSSQIPGEIVDTIVVSQKAINNSPQTIQDLIDGRFRALEYFKSNPKVAAAMIAPRTQVTPEQILNSFQGMTQPNLKENLSLLDQSNPSLIKGMKKLIAVMVKNKIIAEPIDPASILDTRFIKNSKI